MEALRLRVKDVDFDYQQITVRSGKGEKDRRIILPQPLTEPLQYQLARIRLVHEQDLREGFGNRTASLCAGTQVPEGGAGMGVAIRLPFGEPLHRST
jgi:integrase